MFGALFFFGALAALAETAAASRAGKAASATEKLYTHWCTTLNHASDALCRRYAIQEQMRSEPSKTERSNLAIQLAHEPNVRDIPDQYRAARKAFCQLEGSNALSICQQPAPWVPRHHRTDASTQAMYQWLCSKKDRSPAQVDMCKRQVIVGELAKMEGKGVSPAECAKKDRSPALEDVCKRQMTQRLELYKKIRQYPINPMAYQAIIAEYCSLAKNIDSPVCEKVKMARETLELRAFACKGSSSLSSGQWCKETQLKEKRKEMLGRENLAARARLSQEIAEMSRTGASRNQISEEQDQAIELFCAQPTKKSYRLCINGAGGNSYSYDSA